MTYARKMMASTEAQCQVRPEEQNCSELTIIKVGIPCCPLFDRRKSVDIATINILWIGDPHCFESLPRHTISILARPCGLGVFFNADREIEDEESPTMIKDESILLYA